MRKKEKTFQTKLNISDKNLSNTSVNLTDELIHEKIAEFIVSDCQAYHVVEDEGFKGLIKIAFPKYKLPGREFFKTFVTKLFDKFVYFKDFININFK